MRRHVEIGETLISKIRADLVLEDNLAGSMMHNVVAYHHERGDGSGYPRGLTMDQIPIEGRLVAVADIYDALSMRRPYKEAWPEEDCVAELRSQVGKGLLDGQCVGP